MSSIYSPSAVYQMVRRRHDYLMHHGIKGQKWGVRNGPPYPLKKNNKYDIVDPKTKQIHHLVEGTRIRNPQTFAGKGTSTPLKTETKEGLVKEIGGDPDKWQHRKGFGTINYNGENREAEIHGFRKKQLVNTNLKLKNG